MRILLPLAVVAGAVTSAHASTLTVGPGKQYARPCQAIAAAQTGDTIDVDAGHYDGDTCAWTTDALTVRGVGGRAIIDLTGVTPAQQKGIFTIYANMATIENFEFSHAAISQAAGNNGAGIRHQGTHLVVRNCYFHDNQNGILGAPMTAGTGTVFIEQSEFADNGAGDGQSHNAYLNHYASVTLRDSYSHGASVGHLFKSRADFNVIVNNRLTDEAGTTASYELDFPNGGWTYVLGNLIEQSAESQNGGVIAYALEGATNAQQTLFVTHNTVVNNRSAGVYFRLGGNPDVTIANNIFRGPGTLPTTTPTIAFFGNWSDASGDPMLVSPATFDFHLAAGSPAIDQGAILGNGGAMPLTPARQYVHPRSSEPRTQVGAARDPGAYEFGNVVGPDAGPDAGPGDPDAGEGPDAGPGVDGDSGGCGCRSSSGGAGAAGLLVLALGWLVRPRGRARA